MANTSSAKKAVRKQTHRTFINHARISRVRSFVRQVEKAIKEQAPSEAMAAFRVAQSEMMRAVAKGVIHRNTASRKISRLNQRIKSL